MKLRETFKKMVPRERFDRRTAGPKLSRLKHSFIGRFPCKMPQAFLTPTLDLVYIILVPRKGFEPLAFASEAQRSIQLSYRSMFYILT